MSVPAWFDVTAYMANKLSQMQQDHPSGNWTSASLATAFTNAGFLGTEGAYNHFVQHGASEDVAPNSLFNATEYYTAKAAQFYSKSASSLTALEISTVKQLIASAGMNAWTHYNNYGSQEGVNPSNSFDESSYLDAKLAALKAADTTWATKTVTDLQAAIKAAGMTALTHYMTYKGASAAEVASTATYTVPAAEQVSSSTTSNPGNTYVLTTNADILSPTSTTAANVTTNGDDTIYGLTNDSLGSGDVLDGSGGTDSLIANLATSGTINPTLTSIENITLQNATTAVLNTFTYNTGNTTGLTSLTWKDSADTNIDTHNATNLGSGVAVGINNSEGAAHVYSFSYAGLTGTADSVTLNTTGIGTATGAVTITDATTTATDDTGAETVVLNNTGTGSAAASTLGSLVVTDSGAASMNTLTVNATAALTITGSLDFEGTTSGTIDASGSTAAVTLTASGGEAITFTGGSGNDSITAGAGNDNLTGGAGNDTFTISTGNDTVVGGDGNDVVIAADAAITTSDSISFGDGTRDELRFTDVATLNDAGVALTNAQISALTGIEVLGSSAAVTAIDANYFDQSIFNLTGNLVAAVAVTDIDGDTIILSGNGIDLGAGGTAGDALTLSGALPGQSVTLELDDADITGDNATAGNTALTVSSAISTVNILSTTSGTASVTNTLSTEAAAIATHTVDNVSAQNFVLTGTQDFTISTGLTAGFTNAVNFDANAFTGKLSIVGSASADVIKGGSGADTIDGEDGADILTGNGGADTFVFVTTETGNAAPSDVNFETITDYAKNVDIIDWSSNLTIDSATTAAVAGTAQVSAKGIATFHADDDTLAERLSAAIKGFDAAGDFAAFEYSGSTYVIMSGDANATLDAADTLVKLTGVTGVTEATINASNDLVLI